MDARRRLALILWAVCLHSVAAGLGLILSGPVGLQRYGFAFAGEPFFPVQGGVFHLVMALAYAMAARDPDRGRGLILLSISAKFIALLFLLSYYLLVDAIAVVALSGVADGIMGVVMLLAYRSYRSENPEPGAVPGRGR